jgi:glycosyltransferase involved in cell wall biosynthesis
MTTRVAVVTPNYVGGHYGGVETVATWLRDAINGQRGFAAEIISVATSRSDDVSSRLLAPSTWNRGPRSVWHDIGGVPVEHFGSQAAELEPARYLPRDGLTRRLSAFDLVQVVSGTPAFGLVAQRVDRPLCLQVATTVASERQFDGLSNRPIAARLGYTARKVSTGVVGRLERRALRRADHVFVENNWMLGQVQAISRGSVTLAPPGIDDRRFVPRRNESGESFLLSVGRLSSDRKNLSGLLRSYALARHRFGLALPLVIAGGGVLPAALHTLIDDLGMRAHVRVVQDPPGDDLLRLYQDARLLVSASLEEGLGMVYLEAQSCGLPVVSTRNAGVDEIFSRGAVGKLVMPFDGTSEPLGAAMADWASRGAEGHVRAAARQFAIGQFGNHVSASRFMVRYEELLA